MSNYKSYLLRQLGIKESQFKPSIVERNAFPGIDPDELEKGAEDEKEEHDMSAEKAELTARQHLGKPEQGHYYSGMDKAKNMGMLKEKDKMGSLMSPTAKSPQVLAISVRGSSSGGLPTSLSVSDTAIAPEGAGVDPKSKAALGGLELVTRQKPNSTIVDTTPQNDTINSADPIASEVPPTPADEHPSQVQQVDGEPAQALTGTSNSDDAPMGEKPEPEEFETDNDMRLQAALPQGIDIDVPRAEGEEESEDEEDEEKLSKPHMTQDDNKKEFGTPLDEVFARHKKLMAEKLGIGEEVLEEGKHKAGCQCGFCKNKGNIGKKKEEPKDEPEEIEESEEKDNDKENSSHVVKKQYYDSKTKKVKDVDWVTTKKEIKESKYSTAFEKMRGLAGISDTRILASNGIWENAIGDNAPPVNKFKMDAEKGGFVKVTEGGVATECKPCGCNKLNTEHPKKTPKFTSEQLVRIREKILQKGQQQPLTEQEVEISERIASALKVRHG